MADRPWGRGLGPSWAAEAESARDGWRWEEVVCHEARSPESLERPRRWESRAAGPRTCSVQMYFLFPRGGWR